MRALIVDDHPIARQGLGAVLGGLGIEAVLQAQTARDALAAAATRPDLILLDLRIAGVPHTSTLCAQLRQSAPHARIVIVTAYEQAGPIERCLAAGADACLLKDTDVAELRRGLKAILAGQRLIDPRVAQALALDLVDKHRSDGGGALTGRERDVLGLLAEGCSNRLIAERLLIAETTVKGYVSDILRKLGAESRLRAVVRARERGLI